ncbi:hypothetical protein ACFU96_44030 [Streptomyces sp. NPDC057620]|uniref:hypothetical protein n=1 Tax=Streptomyces sp. NPDC057620 TaxID=3346185 RepID=UPI00368288B5
MTIPRERSPRLLSAVTVALVVAGALLLTVPQAPGPPPASAAPHGDDRTPVASPASARTHPAPTAAPAATVSTAPAPAVSASALPPPGEGVAGDADIQKSLESAWPADLPAADEQQLLPAGRGLLRADATGVGRSAWPALFSAGSGQVFAPAFASARFRVQAAIARSASPPGTAVVHLVWAGTDRGGTYADRRVSDWYFTRTTTKGAPSWTPRP